MAENALKIFANREAEMLAQHGLRLVEMLPAGAERIHRELALQVCLAQALQKTVGYSAAEVGTVYARARELSESTGETVQLFPFLHGLWAFRLMRAEYTTALELGKQCRSNRERFRTSPRGPQHFG